MAEQQYPQTSLFMSKATFDQVSFEMWGRSDFDYHSYILSRNEWHDEDIREEASYATGLAHGLRLGLLKARSQRISYQNEYRDQYSALSDEGGSQLGCTSQCDPTFGRHYCHTPHLPQSMAQTSSSPPPRPVLSFSELVRTSSESAALQRQASLVNDRSAPRQEGRDYPYGDIGTEPPFAKTFSSSQLTPLGMPTQNLPLGFEAFYRPGEWIRPVSGAPTSPDGRNVRHSPSDSPESRPRAELPLRQKPQSSAADHNDKSVRDTTVGNQSWFEPDDVCADTSIHSNKREGPKPEDSENDNEEWVNLGTN